MSSDGLVSKRLIRDIMEVFHGRGEREELLDSVALLIRSQMELDCCLIWLFDPPDEYHLSASASDNGCRGAWEKVYSNIRDARDPVASLLASPPPDGAVCKEYAAVPISLRRRARGVLSLGICRSAVSSRRLRMEGREVADLLGTLLRGSTAYKFLQRKNEAMTRLLRVSARLEDCRSLQQCLSAITRAAAELTGSSGAILRTVEDGSLAVRSFFLRDFSDCPVIGVPNDHLIAQRALDSERSIIIDDPDNSPSFVREGGPVRNNLLALPIQWEGVGPGVITVFDRIPGSGGHSPPYSRQDRESLTALARVGAWAVAQMRDASRVRKISRSLENRIRELALLHHISRAALNTDDDRIVVRSLLSAITHREGLGFDRALLFLVDRDDFLLKGSMGVEVIGWDERDTDKDPRSPLDGGSDYWVRNVHRDLDARIEAMTITVDGKGGALARTVLERAPFHVKLPRDRGLVSEDILREMGDVTTFATVPLVSGERVLGVIWADNIHTSRPIGLEDFRLLVSAGAQAGLAVDKAIRTKAIERMKSQLVDLQGKLIEWEKMAVLGEMAASVAHEIRNPLVSIGGFAQRLHKMLTGESRGLKYTDIIMREVARLERTLEDVMSYSRDYTSAHKEMTPLRELLDECVELFRENFRSKGVKLIQSVEDDLPEVLIDQRQVRQAVINILVNSGQVVPEGGEVHLDVLTEGAGHDRVINISVSDAGGGVEPRNLDRIFTPFFTTKGAGTGLGLTIAKRAISGHGGEIRVDNRPGVGVTFSMLIPVNRQGTDETRGEGADRERE